MWLRLALLVASTHGQSTLPPHVWSVPQYGAPYTVTPTAIYTHSGTAMFAMNVNTGATIWNTSNASWLLSVGAAVSVEHDLAVGNALNSPGGGSVYALSATTGKPLWNYTQFYDVVCYPAVFSDTRVFVAVDYLYGFDAESGNYTWYFKHGTDNVIPVAPITASHGYVFVYIIGPRMGNGLLCAVNQTTGVAAWTTPVFVPPNGKVTTTLYVSQAVVSDAGVVYIVYQTTQCNGGYGGVAAFNVTTGKLLWRQTHISSFGCIAPCTETGNGPYLVAPAISNTHNVLIVLNSTSVSGLDATAGGILWGFDVPASIYPPNEFGYWTQPPLVTEDTATVTVWVHGGYAWGGGLYTLGVEYGAVMHTLSLNNKYSPVFYGLTKIANGSTVAVFTVQYQPPSQPYTDVLIAMVVPPPTPTVAASA